MASRDERNPRETVRPVIEVRGISKAFAKTQALSDVDLVAEEGRVLALLGPNGAGKTTLVRILTTLLQPDTGWAEVSGLDVVRDATRLRTVIGLTGQFAAIDLMLTGRENLEMVGELCHIPGRQARARAGDLLDQFDLAAVAEALAKTYSGGMRRRLDLAASLIAKPPVLVLDEPTAGLDPRARSDLWRAVELLVSGGTAVLLTTQYLEEADFLAHRIAADGPWVHRCRRDLPRTQGAGRRRRTRGTPSGNRRVRKCLDSAVRNTRGQDC